MRIKSNDIVILDTTDTKKLDVHISSNHPTIQIYNQNTTQGTYTPDWSSNPLVLTATIYADSTNITSTISSFKWSRIIGDVVEILDTTTNTLTISENDLNNSTGMVIYTCSITYNDRTSENRITFARTDAGKDGVKGNNAPAVKAQYSIDGNSDWTYSLNVSAHKYIRFSYDNGATWTSAIKIYGEDGKSVEIKGVAYTKDTPVAGQIIVLYSDINTSTKITNATNGDSYLVDGYLCVYNGTNFICTGQIQGPKGEKGDSYYLFIRYANNTNGSGISTSPDGKSYIGFYRSSVNQVPTDVSSATWNWAKFAGEDAKIITLTGSAQAFKVDKSKTVSPETIVVTAHVENTTIQSSGWTYSTDGGKTFTSSIPAGISRSGNVITITGASIDSNAISIKASDDTHSDIFTVYKVSDGYDGKTGDEGKPAPIAFLTNENITFAANSSGQVTGTTVYCNVVAYSGITQVAPTIGTILSTELPAGMSIDPDNITTVSNQVRIPIVIANNATLGSVNNTNGVINIPVTSPVSTTLQLTWSKINSGVKGDNAPAVKAQYSVDGATNWNTSLDVSAHKYVRLSYDDGKTWSAAMKIVGDDAKSIILTANSQIFKIDKSYAITPATITVTAQTINTTISTSGWTYSTDGGKTFTTTVPTGVVRNGNTITITGSTLIANSIVIKASDGTHSDTLTIYKVLDGVDAPIAFLTNENITFSANAQGQISGTTITSNVVAYNGTNKVTPTIGTITGVPTGMTITPSIVGNEIKLTIAIAGNSTLGSTSSNMGVINIPITSPVSTTLYLTWSKVNTGATGASIKSTTVSYGVSDSASTRPDDTTWQSTIPVVAEGKYLWTRTIIDYTDDSIADTITYTYVKQGSTGAIGPTGSSGTSVTVKSIKYQSGTSATTAPTGTWSDSVVAVGEGSYLWTQTTFSDNKVAYGVARQGIDGNNGRGITSIIEQYYQSTSATTQSGGSWSATVPAWSDGKYIWTRSVITYTDSTTSTTSPICITGQKGGTGVGVSSVDVWYYQSTSATSLSGGSWSTTAPAWVDGKYTWTKTITTYTNNTTDETSAVCITGQKGSTGVGVKSVTEYYLATSSSSGVTTSTSGWTTTVQTITLDKKYLWNYEVITYTNDTTSTTAPIIIGVFGNTGKGIKSVTEYYLATSSSSGVTTSTSGWKDTMQTLTPANKYLWNYELITYTDNSTATINPVIIGVYGDQGIQGIQGPKGNDAYTVMLTNESHIFAGDVSNAITGSATTQVLAYNGSTEQTVTIVSVNGKTAATADTDTGITGLKFKCSALSGASPTITFTCTTSFVSKSGTIPIVLSVGGVSFTKMFTYSIAFKGTTGSPGNPGSPGTPASLVDITPSALYFKSTTGKDGAFTPDYIYLYPRFQTVVYSKWEYSTNGGTTWITASGANGLTIGTYNSVNNVLRIAKTSTLYTDTVTSISFRCVSSNASVYDTVSIAKIYDVVDLQIGGRNLVLASNTPYSNSEYRVASYNMSEDWELNTTYTLTLKGTIDTGRIFGAWANGSGTRVATLTYDSAKDLYISTFTTPASIATQTPKVINIYNTPSTTVGNASIEWIKLEKGNKETDWSPSPEDLVTFQLYAPKGYLLTNDIQELTLETFAYGGSQAITNATFTWYSWNGEVWVVISGATGTSLTLNKTNVFKSSVYKCEMKYNNKIYTATATVEDKTDVYNSLIRVNAKYSPTNRMYWILYAAAYSEEGERDALLGPISETAPTGVSAGAYWYKVDSANYTVTLMKYSGTAWAATTDKQELLYDWFLFKDPTDMVTLGAQSKVKIVTASDFSKVCNVQCNISDPNHLLLTMNNQMLNDPSDPVVSATEPTNPVDGQLWVKIGDNGTYVISIWSQADKKWIISEADSTKKVYVEKPAQYNAGDIWIVNSDYQPIAYKEGVIQKVTVDGVEQTVKHLAGTMLKAQYPSQTYKDSDWVEALTYYRKEIDKIKDDLNTYNQFFSFDDSGLTMQAKNKAGAISEFKTKLTNTELGFYQGEDRVAYINNSQLNISKAQINDGLTVAGTLPKLSIGGFSIIQESNGSLSIVANI